MSNIEPVDSASVLNGRQFRGLIERFAIYAVAFSMGRYVSPELQEGIVSVIVPMALAGITAIGGYYFNRNIGLIIGTAELPDVKTVEMTTEAGANAIPSENVIPPRPAPPLPTPAPSPPLPTAPRPAPPRPVLPRSTPPRLPPRSPPNKKGRR